MSLTEKLQKEILVLARKTLENKLAGKKHNPKDYKLANLLEKRGVFVTLNKAGKLRGCMGNISPDLSIYEGVKKLALTSALNDPRFAAVSEKELSAIKIEISLLTVPKEIKGKSTEEKIKKVKPAIDGVIIKSGFRSATFLPQVWEQLPTIEDFFSHLCEKAGLAKDHWKTSELEIQSYQAEHFEENKE